MGFQGQTPSSNLKKITLCANSEPPAVMLYEPYMVQNSILVEVAQNADAIIYQLYSKSNYKDKNCTIML